MKTSYSLPQTPSVSRFCPPWDTDGWYYVCPNFDKKAKVHSNSDLFVLKYGIDALKGADYIVTYDSILDGKDDHQECDFYAEKNSVLYLAFDGEAAAKNDVPQWLRNDFKPCGAEILMSDKTTHYALFSREISAGEHVITADFSGNYHHYFLIVVSKEETAPGALVSAPANTQNDRKYISRDYRNEYGCIISECFNFGIPDSFVWGGDVSAISAMISLTLIKRFACSKGTTSLRIEMGEISKTMLLIPAFIVSFVEVIKLDDSRSSIV